MNLKLCMHVSILHPEKNAYVTHHPTKYLYPQMHKKKKTCTRTYYLIR